MNKVCSIDSGIISPFALQKIDDNDSEEIPLKIGRTVVGRDDTSNIIIESMFCSRQHCILDVQDTEVVLIDCSSWGTYINDVKYKHQSTKLNVNDVIGFGVSNNEEALKTKQYTNVFNYRLLKRLSSVNAAQANDFHEDLEDFSHSLFNEVISSGKEISMDEEYEQWYYEPNDSNDCNNFEWNNFELDILRMEVFVPKLLRSRPQEKNISKRKSISPVNNKAPKKKPKPSEEYVSKASNVSFLKPILKKRREQELYYTRIGDKKQVVINEEKSITYYFEKNSDEESEIIIRGYDSDSYSSDDV